VVDRISPALKACNATLESVYYTFGDADLVAIIDFATPEDAAAFALAVTSSGALRSYKTTQLLTVEQGITAMKRGEQARTKYTPPVVVDLVDRKATAKR
jgi:uncharacterized protein with GYD domain